MTHEELRDRLLDLAYGELPPRDARKVEEHAASCEACGAALARIRATRRTMAALPEEPAPPAGERILVAAARAAARRERRPLVPRWAWGAAVAAASLLVVASVSYRIMVMRPGGAGGEDPRALMGDSRYARPPPHGAEREPRAPDGEEVVSAPDASTAPQEAPLAKGAAPAATRAPDPAPPHERRQRFATAPPPGDSSAVPVPAPAPGRRAAPEPPAAASQAGPEPSPSPAERSATAAPEASRGEERPLAAARPQRAMSAQAPPEAKAGVPAAVLRYEELRRAGLLRGEVRTFPGCDGELWRKVERDADGRVLSYTREGFVGEARVRLEVVYGADGDAARVIVTDAASSAPLRGVRPWVPSAEDADGPPRCR